MSKPVNLNWERVKSKLNPYRKEGPTREMRQWSLNVIGSTFIGVLLGVKLGGRFLRERYIYYSRGQVYHHAVEAHRKMHSYTVRGAVNLGSKWGWKLGIFAAVYSGVQISVAVYRDRKDVLNYMCAGLIAGPVLYLTKGIRPMIGGSFVGVILSVPIGMCAWLVDSVTDWAEAWSERKKESVEISEETSEFKDEEDKEKEE